MDRAIFVVTGHPRSSALIRAGAQAQVVVVKVAHAVVLAPGEQAGHPPLAVPRAVPELVYGR